MIRDPNRFLHLVWFDVLDGQHAKLESM